MAKKKEKTVKKMTLRQRLRVSSEEKLLGLMEQTVEAVTPIAEKAGVNKYDLMKVCLTGYNKTLRDQLICDLANNAEAELERLYNNQVDAFAGKESPND